MDKSKVLELILVQWVAALKSKDRRRENVRPNFEELFLSWKQADASFEDLYETFLPKAIKAHQPTPSVARKSYRVLKEKLGKMMDKDEKEFVEEWNSSIEATATESFFEFFPATALDSDNEPKVFGNMSAKEYYAQRRYADQFPTLDTTELVKQWKKEQEQLELEQMLNVLGDKDETNS
jgi:hypothetical protein